MAGPATSPPLQPPPTVNFLNPFQRSRLLKSTRKLANILGTTPHLVDSPPPSPSDSSSPSSWDHGKRVPSKPLKQKASNLKKLWSGSDMPPLVLRLHLPPPPSPSSSLKYHEEAIRASSPTQIGTPLSAKLARTTSNASSIQSMPRIYEEEDDVVIKERANRKGAKVSRKRMAKLTRVFGENVPPELVLNVNPRHRYSQNSHPHHHHRFSSEDLNVRVTVPDPISASPRHRNLAPLEPLEPSTSNPPSPPSPLPTQNLTSAPVSIVPSSFLPYIIPKRYISPTKNSNRHRRSGTAGSTDSQIPFLSPVPAYTDFADHRPHSHHYPTSVSQSPRTQQQYRSPSRSRSHSRTSIGSILSNLSSPSSNHSHAHLRRPMSPDRRRGETDWNGEWNVKDTRIRAMALRSLRQ